MITCPGVVGRTFEIGDMGKKTRGDALVKEGFHAFGLRGNNKETFAMGKNLKGDADVAGINFGKDGGPIGGCMWPSELHAALWMPFGREEGGANLCLLGTGLVGKLKVKGEIAYDWSGWGEMDGHGKGRAELRVEGCRTTATYRTGLDGDAKGREGAIAEAGRES